LEVASRVAVKRTEVNHFLAYAAEAEAYAASAPEVEEELRIKLVRPLTEDDLVILRRSWPGPLFNRAAMFLDLALEPDAAEDAISNLAELYARRLAVNPGHAKRWLVAQVLWVVFGRAMDLFSRFTRARAGK
jgi:hypothetical protein